MTILLNIVVAIPCSDEEEDEICRYVEEIIRKNKPELAKRLTRSTIIFIVEELVRRKIIDKKTAYRLLRKYLSKLG